MIKIINIGIYTKDEKILRQIGEELIKERHQGLNFYFITNPKYLSGDYIIAFSEDKELIEKGQPIILTEDPKSQGIFFFQSKKNIKQGILNSILGEKKTTSTEVKTQTISLISYMDECSPPVINHFLAKELALEGKKACSISFNIFFPYDYIRDNPGKKGLIKSLYYLNSDQELNPSIITFNKKDNYHYIENDINYDELKKVGTDLLVALKKLLTKEGFDYLLIDFSRFSLDLFKEFADQTEVRILIEGFGGEIEHLIEEKSMELLGKGDITGPYLTEGEAYTIKGRLLILNNGSEELIKWKRILRERLLKP